VTHFSTRRSQCQDIVTNGVSLLQTQLGHREGHEARRMGLKAMLLDQHMAGRHGERQPGVARRPDAVHDPLAMADHGQHGKHRLHHQALLPRAALTSRQVGGVALHRMAARIARDHHALLTLPHEPLQGGIHDLGGGTRPGHHQAVLVQQQTPCAADHPPVVREAGATTLLGAAALPDGMDQLEPVRVDDAEPGRRGQEGLGPVLRCPEEAKEAGALGEPGKQRPRVARHPAIEGPVAHAVECLQQPQGDLCSAIILYPSLWTITLTAGIIARDHHPCRRGILWQ